jgi:hypothetical protein
VRCSGSSGLYVSREIPNPFQRLLTFGKFPGKELPAVEHSLCNVKTDVDLFALRFFDKCRDPVKEQLVGDRPGSGAEGVP